MLARRGRIDSHRRDIQGLFCGALPIAVGSTFLSGRIMHAVVFGR